jgi:hypothetical protein
MADTNVIPWRSVRGVGIGGADPSHSSGFSEQRLTTSHSSAAKGGKEDDMSNLHRSLDDNVYDLNAILHPGSVFDHPRDVLADATLSRSEKRAILASWASDAAAVSSCPSLRAIPGTRKTVSIDEILEALSSLDHSPRNPPGGKSARIRSAERISAAA